MSNIDFLEILREHAYNNIDTNNSILDLQGWISTQFHTKFTEIITASYESLQRPLVIIEIGSWKGLSACTMASIAKENNIPCKIICIDTWLGSPDYWTTGINDVDKGASLNLKNGYPQVYYTFLNNIILQNHNDIIIPLPMSSNEAANILSFYGIIGDIIYIDAATEYDAIFNNISKYWKLMHNNGYIFGNNYNDNNQGVKMAMNDFTRAVCINKNISDILWILQKPIDYM